MSSCRLPILSRFSLPSKELLIKYINHTNNRDLSSNQIDFGTPVLLSEDGKTEVPISFQSETGWEQASNKLTYWRQELSKIPGCQRLTTSSDYDDHLGLLDDLFEQYGLLIEYDHVSFSDPSHGEDGVVDYTLTFVDHLIFFGSFTLQVRPTIEFLGTSITQLMDLREFYSDGNRNRVPVDLYCQNGELLLHEAVVTNHTTRSALELTLYSVLSDTPIVDPIPLVEILNLLTGDDWVCVDDEAPFNLKGSVVLYNGLRSEEHQVESPSYGYVMVIELGDLCQNLEGLITIGYRYSQPFQAGSSLGYPASPNTILTPR